jgi:hypothetical protein
MITLHRKHFLTLGTLIALAVFAVTAAPVPTQAAATTLAPAAATTPAPAAPTTAPAPASDTTSNSSGAIELGNPLRAQSLQELIMEILGYVQAIGFMVITVMIIYIGFQFVVAQGNPEAVSKARTSLIWTLIGGLILLGASALATVVASTAANL